MKTLKAAIVGAGNITGEHLKFFPGREDVELSAICDLSPALGRYFARRYGAGGSYTDYREMLEKVRPDVVHVCTPPHVHFPIARDCLEAGAHVICEKPITVTRQEYLDLAEIARSKGLLLTEDHTYRFTREYLELESIVEEGALGTIREVETRFCLDIAEGGRYGSSDLPHPSHGLPAGVLHDFLPHMTYLTNRFLRSHDEVRACWRQHTGNRLFRHDDLDAIVIDDEGRHGRLRFTCQQHPEAFQIFVRGDEGWAELEYFRPFLRVTRARPGGSKLGPLVNHVYNGLELVRAGVVGVKDKILQRSVYEGLVKFLELTYDAIRDGEEPPVTHEDIDRSLILIDRLLEEESLI